MAGSLILIDVLDSFTPVATATVLHGFIQVISSGSRAILHPRYLAWPLIGREVSSCPRENWYGAFQAASRHTWVAPSAFPRLAPRW
ncbi:MAG: hypothetical protein ACOYMK_06385 [Hyphomonadaceae bacterium]|jgi:hypothetical protein